MTEIFHDNTCLMILNDELNCKVSTIFMNPRYIHVETFRKCHSFGKFVEFEDLKVWLTSKTCRFGCLMFWLTDNFVTTSVFWAFQANKICPGQISDAVELHGPKINKIQDRPI
jgi:hypothetical protein